jgi:hypothetical protein
MLKTEITQDCIAIDDPVDGLRYQITTTVIDDPVVHAGELPDTYLFLFEIVVPADAKADLFVRVCNPYDFDSVVIGRAAALTAGVTRFRTNEFTVRYADLELAVQARQAINQRIDTAINTFYIFKSEFYTPVVTPDYRPSTDEEYLVTLTNTYKTATAARETAEAAVVTATAAVTAAIAAAATAAQLVQIYARETTFCQTGRVTYWASATGVMAGATNLATASKTFFNDQVTWFNANNPIHDVYPDISHCSGIWLTLGMELQTMEAALSSWGISEPNVALLDSTLTSFCSDASTGYASAVTAKAVADVAVATAQTAKQKTDADLASAIAAEDAALAAIKAVCPTFDPSSV